MSEDLMKRLQSLHKQATVERSHFYVGSCVRDAMRRIEKLEANALANRVGIMRLEAENKTLRSMVADVIADTGDDPKIMAASRSEWAARAFAAEVELEQSKVENEKYYDAWLDAQAEIIELEAKLVKAVEALDGMLGLFSADNLLLRGTHLNMELDNARIILAELKRTRQWMNLSNSSR